MSDLLPCPFCGGEAVKVDGFTVACAHGLCIGWTVRRASPHEWNTRALPAVQPDREQVAFSMWKAEADRAAPNVGKNRIPSGFMVASDADREKWLGLADAAILAMMGESHE